MIIKIHKREDPYARIDNKALSDKRLSYRARGILAYLLSKPNDWQVRTEEVIDGGLEGREAVRAAFRELAAIGYAELKNTSGGREWVIHETPAIAQEPVDGPPPRKPTDQKPVSLVTKEKSTNKRVLLELAEPIYQAYPRKVGKPVALKAIVKAIQRESDQGGEPSTDAISRLLEKTVAFAQCWNGDLEFCPHPATWFNQERYNDDPSTWRRNDTNQKSHTRGSRTVGTANTRRTGQYDQVGKV